MHCNSRAAAVGALLFLTSLAAGEVGATRSVVDILDVPRGQQSLDTPRVSITADGEPVLGTWFHLEGTPEGAADSILGVEWTQKAGPASEFFETCRRQRALWLFLAKTGNYAFTFRARSQAGWSTPAEVRFAVNPGRPYLSLDEALKRAGSCEKIVLPGTGWKQVAGPFAAPASQPDPSGTTVRPNDAGLYIFEAPRLSLDALPQRRGIFVPPAADGVSGDRRPIAKLLNRITGSVTLPVDVDGSLSTDPDAGDVAGLTARWSTPDTNLAVELVPQPGLHARFSASKAGMYSVLLTVSDGRLESSPARVFIEISDARPGPKSEEDGGDAGVDLLERPVSLAIWPPTPLADGTVYTPDETGLERAVQLFPKRCGIGLLVDSGVAKPGHFKDIPLSVEVSKAPLVHLLDAIARQSDCVYRRDGNKAIWLMHAADAHRSEPIEPVASSIEALSEKPDGADIVEPLRAYAEPLLRAHPDASFTYDAGRHSIVAVLPATAGKHLREIVQSLRIPPAPDLPVTVVTTPELALKNVLGEKTISLKGRFRLDLLVREISQQSGVALSFDPRQFENKLPHLKVNFERTVLRQVLRDLVEEAGFSGCSVEPPSGAWLYKGARPYPSGETLWDRAYVNTYDLTPLFRDLTPDVALLLNGETIAHMIRSRVYPASWNEPGVLMFYHEMTRKLVVLHGSAVHQKIAELLNDLRERGEGALGVTE